MRHCMQGSCGYGVLDKTKYPYWSVGALSTQNVFYLQGPVRGCGWVQASQSFLLYCSFFGVLNYQRHAYKVSYATHALLLLLDCMLNLES